MQIALAVIYTLLAIIHLASLVLNVVVLLDFDLNIVKSTQIMISLATSVPLFLSDVLSLLMIGKVVSDTYRAVVDYMDAFSCFLFVCMTIHLTNSKLLQLIKGFAKAYYNLLVKFLVIKLIFLLVGFYIGLIICYGSRDDFIPAFTAIYYNGVGITNFFYLLIYRSKMLEFKVGTTPLEQKSGGKFSMLFKKSHKMQQPEESEAASVKSNGANYESAFVEVNSTYKGGAILSFLQISTSVILLGVFRDASFYSGRYITIPWKAASGLGLCIFASIYLKRNN